MLKTRLTQYQWLAILVLGLLTSACRPEPDPPTTPLPEAFIGQNTPFNPSYSS